VNDTMDNILFERYNYKNNVLDGLYQRWYENGKLCQAVEYTNGILNGFHKTYDDTGNLRYECWYENGTFIHNN